MVHDKHWLRELLLLMLTAGESGKAPSVKSANCNHSDKWRIASTAKSRLHRNCGTRRSIISLSSGASRKLGVHTSKSEKPTEATLLISGKSSDAFSEVHSQVSVQPSC